MIEAEKKESKKKEEKKKSEEKKEKKEDPKDSKLRDLTETLQRLQADFENYKKRSEKSNEEFRKYILQEFVLKILPLIDNFELALKNKKSTDEFCKRIEMIYAQFVQLLEELGVKPIDTKEKKFDPYFHEALLTEESDKDDIILEELQKGYTLHDRVIRHAKVKIGKVKK